MLPRIIVCERCLDPSDPALARLTGDGFEVVHSQTCEELIAQAIERRPAAVICQVDSPTSHDIGMLTLLRRVHPDMPLILLSTEGSLEIQRTVLSLRPIYFAVMPVDEYELSEALRGTLLKAAGQSAGLTPRHS